MKLTIFGLTITSSWGNGHATTYRSLVKGLAGRGHQVSFIEKDQEWYRNHRDLPSPEFAQVTLYQDWRQSGKSLVREALDADAVMIGSYFPDGVAAARELLDAGCDSLIFYDIDTPITLERLRHEGRTEALDSSMIPQFAAYLSFTGGPTLDKLRRSYGARRTFPFYCSVDPDRHRPVPPNPDFRCDLGYLGTYAADRHWKLVELMNRPAALLPEASFLVAGSLYPDGVDWPKNVRRIDHLAPPEHAAFYCSSRFTLNLTRDAMAKTGYSPSVRLFEAAACGTPILSDAWPGLDQFLTPGEEILIPRDGFEVCSILRDMPESRTTAVSRRARERVLAEHSSTERAIQFERIVSECSQAEKIPAMKAAS